jgi:hypothetical protein
VVETHTRQSWRQKIQKLWPALNLFTTTFPSQPPSHDLPHATLCRGILQKFTTKLIVLEKSKQNMDILGKNLCFCQKSIFNPVKYESGADLNRK